MTENNQPDLTKSRHYNLITTLASLLCATAICFLMIGSFTALSIAQHLPSSHDIKKIELKIPLRIYSSDNKLIAEYGDERRKPVDLTEVPNTLIQAILASEDDRFYSHPGIDIAGIIRAIITNFKSNDNRQGASTITMQVARNYFLSFEKTYSRKLREILLAFKLESTLSKQDILQLYLNKIFLGHRAYGFGAAAEVYYGKPLQELTLAEQAMLAGLPKAPSRSNPISNPERALTRRNYVLNRLQEKNWINQTQYNTAIKAPITAKKHSKKFELHAPFVAEMVRSILLHEYGEQAYWQGLNVYTTLNSARQLAAETALRSGLLAYDKRHGFRGATNSLSIDQDTEALIQELKKIQPSRDIIPAVVLQVNTDQANLLTSNNDSITIQHDQVQWAKKYRNANIVGSPPQKVNQVLNRGDIVYVQPSNDGQWHLSQLPQVQGALVSIEPRSGKIVALTGGFDYYFNKYNRAIQARRQPGSGIKPFIYAAALQKGYAPSSLISGAPIVITEPSQETVWRPQNYSGKFYGPTSIRQALTSSMNIVSIRLLRAIGINHTKEYLSRFGLKPDHLPNSLSLALGAGNLTPLEVATAYSALANTGYLVTPFIIERIESKNHETLFEQSPTQLCDHCTNTALNTANMAPRIMTKQDNFLIVNMMQDVIRHGTGKKALVLERNDLAGKTGTTNDYIDAWFSGFSPSVATTVWVGFDRPQTLGHAESGGRAALPIWIDYMRTALQSTPEESYAIPDGITQHFDERSQQTDYYATRHNSPHTSLNGIIETNPPESSNNRPERSHANSTIQDELF